VRGKAVPPPTNGRLVQVDLSSLIEEGWVAPTSPDWFKKAVSAELEKYGLAMPVRKRE
jgi:hypothetical protein